MLMNPLEELVVDGLVLPAPLDFVRGFLDVADDHDDHDGGDVGDDQT